jgi:hypothetical protein
MKWFRRIAKCVSSHGGWVHRICEIKVRRSDIFIDNRPLNKRQLRRSGILGRVASSGIFKPGTVHCVRPDVAPTELGAICLPRCYKDFAPTELGQFICGVAIEKTLLRSWGNLSMALLSKKDARTELGQFVHGVAIERGLLGSLPWLRGAFCTFGKDFWDFHKHESKTC